MNNDYFFMKIDEKRRKTENKQKSVLVFTDMYAIFLKFSHSDLKGYCDESRFEKKFHILVQTRI